LLFLGIFGYSQSAVNLMACDREILTKASLRRRQQKS